MESWASLLVAYALGSLSFASLVARARGIDIRSRGSGNPGATNVGRVLGRSWGRGVLLLDIAKGLLPVLLLRAFPGTLDQDGCAPVAAAVVVGHVFPIWHGFAGGKGVATLIGALLAVDPWLGGAAVLLHVAVKRATGYVSAASLALAWSFPLLQLAARAAELSVRRTDGTLTYAALALLVTWRHRDNVRRLGAGTEPRYDARGASVQPTQVRES